MITSLDDIKRQAGIDLDATTDDDILFELQKSAEDKAQNYCNRKFESQTFTEYYNGDGSNILMLNNYPIASITSIHDDPDREYNSDDLISSDDYALDALPGIVELDALTFGHGVKNIKVIYVGGYEAKDMPDDLKTAIASLVVADYLEKKASVNAIGEGEVIYRPAKLRKEAYSTLDLYKRYR